MLILEKRKLALSDARFPNKDKYQRLHPYLQKLKIAPQTDSHLKNIKGKVKNHDCEQYIIECTSPISVIKKILDIKPEDRLYCDCNECEGLDGVDNEITDQTPFLRCIFDRPSKGETSTYLAAHIQAPSLDVLAKRILRVDPKTTKTGRQFLVNLGWDKQNITNKLAVSDPETSDIDTEMYNTDNLARFAYNPNSDVSMNVQQSQGHNIGDWNANQKNPGTLQQIQSLGQFD